MEAFNIIENLKQKSLIPLEHAKVKKAIVSGSYYGIQYKKDPDETGVQQ